MDQLFPLVRLRDLQYCFPQKLLVRILMSAASGTSTKDLGSDFWNRMHLICHWLTSLRIQSITQHQYLCTKVCVYVVPVKSTGIDRS